MASFPETLIGDPAARSEFYVAHGFDAEIADFPAEAFDEMANAAGIAPPDEGIDDENDLRSVRAFKRLLVFERQFREFIDSVMMKVFGADWMKHQLPNNMLEDWLDKKAKAAKNGEPDAPLIHYAISPTTSASSARATTGGRRFSRFSAAASRASGSHSSASAPRGSRPCMRASLRWMTSGSFGLNSNGCARPLARTDRRSVGR